MLRYFNSIRNCLIVYFIYSSLSIYAQVYPTIGQFNYVQLQFNPACAGAVSTLRANVMHRAHWTNLPGAPNLQLITLDKPLGRNLGGGIVISRHAVGSTSDASVNGNVSYKIRTGESSNFMFGFKGGFSFVANGIQDEFVWDESDQVIAGIGKRGMVLKGGPGGYYKRKHFYAGVSAPDFFFLDLQKIYFDDQNNKSTLRNNFFLIAGTRKSITEFISLHPSFMLKYYAGRPINYFANIGVEFNQTFTAGVGFVYPMAASIYTRIAVSSKLKLGFRYEMSSKYFTLGSYGSSEIMLSYGF